MTDVKAQLDLAHLARVQRILEVLTEIDVSLPLSVLACEDAMVALIVGFQCGQTTAAQVLRGHIGAVDDLK